MVNNIKREALLHVVAEWLEETTLPPMVPRTDYDIKPDNLLRILAIVGPRRAGKTYFMYQLIQSLLRDGRYTKKDILFLDFEDFRLSGLSGIDIDEVFSAFYKLADKYPKPLLSGKSCGI